MRRFASALLAVSSLAPCSSAQAWEVRARFVERVGTTDIVLHNNELHTGGQMSVRNIRLQLGVFDDAAGPAPAGGIYGMIDTTALVGGGMTVSRNPGRFPVFSYPVGGNGEPAGDPFRVLTNIDALVGPQTIAWTCSESSPAPQPAAVIRGRNTFVSVWSMTVQENSSLCLGRGRAAFTGEILTANQWNLEGAPLPPICSNPPAPGSVTYTPTLLAGTPFTVELRIVVGGPPHPAPTYYSCAGDWNFDDVLNSVDVFDFLADFFAGAGDANCDSQTNSEDFFFFLARFFADCGPS